VVLFFCTSAPGPCNFKEEAPAGLADCWFSWKKLHVSWYLFCGTILSFGIATFESCRLRRLVYLIGHVRKSVSREGSLRARAH